MPQLRPISRIACIGEVMIELAALDHDTAAIGVAGDTYNTAVYLRRELASAALAVEVSYVTALGDDLMSQRIRADMQRHELDTRYVETRPGRAPGLYTIETDELGERRFSYWREHSAARTLFQSPAGTALEKLLDFDLIYLSGISLAILPESSRSALMAMLNTCREAGIHIAFDSNYRPRLWTSPDIARAVTSEMWAAVDIALPSLDDEIDLFVDVDGDAVVERLRSSGVKSGAMKRGVEGPIGLGTGDQQLASMHFQPAETVLDTTAAGDSFNAGWLAAFAHGAPEDARLLAGHNLARQVVQARGAVVCTEPVLNK